MPLWMIPEVALDSSKRKGREQTQLHTLVIIISDVMVSEFLFNFSIYSFQKLYLSLLQ